MLVESLHIAEETSTRPVLTLPTATRISDGETIRKPRTGTPPILTAVAPVRFVPVIVTVPPAGAVVGVNDVIVGTGKASTVSVNGALAPIGLVTMMSLTPAATVLGTVTVICVGLTTVKAAETPPILTALVPVKLEPVRVMVLPGVVEVGEMLETEGVGFNNAVMDVRYKPSLPGVKIKSPAAPIG